MTSLILILTYLLTLFGVFIDIKIISLIFLISALIYFLKTKTINISSKPVFYFLLFLIFTSFTLFFSYDKALNLEGLIIYLTAFFWFVISFQNQEKIKSQLFSFFFLSSFITATSFYLGKIFHFKYLEEPTALIFSGYNHNLIGDFLALALVYFSYLLIVKNQKKIIFLILLILPAFIFSFSRTAFLSVSITLILFLILTKKPSNIFNYLILIILIIVSVFSTVYFSQELFSLLPRSVQKILNIKKEKTFLANRPKYFAYSLKTFIKNPLGVGINNLQYHTSKYQFTFEEGVTTAHNFFLDVLVENGFLSFLFLLILLFYVFKNSQKNEYFYVFLSLNIIFLTDFFHRFDFILIFYFIILGLISDKKNNIFSFDKKYFLFLNITVFFINLIITTSYIFNNLNQKELAIKIYPINWRFYSTLIYDLKNKDYQKTLNYLDVFEKKFTNGDTVNLIKAKNFLRFNITEKALFYFEKAFLEKPILIQEYFVDYMNLNMEIYGEDQGKTKAKKFFKKLIINLNIPKNAFIYREIINRCADYRIACH